MSAPWPYDDDPSPERLPAPSWACPEGRCVCGAVKEDTPKETFSILLRAHGGETMPGARCRVFVNDSLVNDDKPYADGSGRIEIKCRHRPVTARVEWAPANTPQEAIYPYRKAYYIDLRQDTRVEAARRRLHNLGYSARDEMRENIKEYQRNHGYTYVSGLLEDIEDELIAYHDRGVEPAPAPPDTGADDGGPS